MNKTRLQRLENATRGVMSGIRCPTCHCFGGDGSTGPAVIHITGDGPVPTDEQLTCPACGAHRGLVRIVTPLTRELQRQLVHNPSLTYDAFLAAMEEAGAGSKPAAQSRAARPCKRATGAET